MNLLLGRSQKDAAFSLVPLRIGRGVIFNLLAELELDPEETRLIHLYRFSGAVLVRSNAIDDLKKAFRPALLLGIVSYFLSLFILSYFMAAGLAVLVTLIMTGVYFYALREQIMVSDLLHGGRTFRCDSIIELIEKEAFLQSISEYLRQVLESAKRWDSRERIKILPLTAEEAKRAILARRRA
ncbi:hypothetical protein [Roseibium sp. M-1]